MSITDNQPHAPGGLTVGVRELRGNLTRYLRQVRQGTPILVTSHDAVIAEIHPPATHNLTPRQAGALRGKIRIAEDFDDMPEDMLTAIEQ